MPVQEPQAFVYLGSAGGPSVSPSWTASSAECGSQFGHEVATAGDVNGDGYADVLVGEPFDSSIAASGRASVYLGNQGGSITMKPQQRRVDDSGPIAHGGQTDSPSGFRVSLFGRTPFGRGRIKLEQEVKPVGELFNGDGTVVSASWRDAGASGAEFNELVGGLSAATEYHWRVRLRYDLVGNPFQGRGRWITVPWNGWQESDLRTTAVVPAGSVPDGNAVTDQGLSVALLPGGEIALSWGASCLSTDTDYEVYEGQAGSFADHTPRFCSTGGATTVTFTPAAGSTYYLVVPRNATREGSYGLRSDSSERPRGPSPCLEQSLGQCQ